MTEVLLPLHVDLVHLGLDTLDHVITVVTPGAQHGDDGTDVTLSV